MWYYQVFVQENGEIDMFRFNQSLTRRLVVVLAMVALLAGSVLPAEGQKRRRTRRRARVTRPAVVVPTYVVAANTTIRVRMNEKISSKDAKVGDQFTTTVVDPVYVGGVEVIPAASIITGSVTSVKRAARKSKPGTLGVGFISCRTPQDRVYLINGSLTSLDETEVNTDNEGGVTGRSAKKRNIVFIGGGATGGALIGAIAGGGSGAAIGAAVGAGLGIAGSYYSKGKEAEVKPGNEFGVILNRSVSMYASTSR